MSDYYKKFDVPENVDTWIDTIHGKKVLQAIFMSFCTTNETQTFKAEIHSVMLTEWIIENSPSDLDDLAKLIKKAMSGK